MATTKFTNVAALTVAVALAKGETPNLPDGVTMDTVVGKLSHMLEQASKTRKSVKSGPSKSERLLIALADAVVAKMVAGEDYTTADVRDLIDRDMVMTYAVPFNRDGIVSAQKITSIMTNARNRGLVEKVEGAKVATYRLA